MKKIAIIVLMGFSVMACTSTSNMKHLVEVSDEPKMLRGFVDHVGETRERLSHTMAVGDPAGIHYAYDLEVGNLVAVWQGQFVDATPMWDNRGNGSFRPLGMMQYLDKGQSLARLNKDKDDFSTEQNAKQFRPRGYAIDSDSGHPVFKYDFEGLQVLDKTYPDEKQTSFIREISIPNKERGKNLYFKLAEATDIVELSKGVYSVDDRQFYLQVLSGPKPTIRRLNGRQQLIVNLSSDDITYKIIW